MSRGSEAAVGAGAAARVESAARPMADTTSLSLVRSSSSDTGGCGEWWNVFGGGSSRANDVPGMRFAGRVRVF